MKARHFFPASRPLVAAIVVAALSGIAQADEVSDLVDAPSAKWRATCNARPIASRMERQSPGPKRLTVHYTDTPKNQTRTLNEKLCILYRFATTVVEGSKKKLWGDIPYHYYISSDGRLGEARNPAYLVDSNTSYDREGHIAIVIEGDARDGISPGQRKKLFALLAALQKKWNVPRARISTHSHFAETDCPGPAILRAVSEFVQRTIEPVFRPQPIARPQPINRPQPRPNPQATPNCEKEDCAPWHKW